MAHRGVRTGAHYFAQAGKTTVLGREIDYGCRQPLRDQVRGETAKTDGCKRKQ